MAGEEEERFSVAVLGQAVLLADYYVQKQRAKQFCPVAEVRTCKLSFWENPLCKFTDLIELKINPGQYSINMS